VAQPATQDKGGKEVAHVEAPTFGYVGSGPYGGDGGGHGGASLRHHPFPNPRRREDPHSGSRTPGGATPSESQDPPGLTPGGPDQSSAAIRRVVTH